MRKGGVQIRLRSEILSVERDEQGYRLQVNGETLVTKKLVIASGGLSMPGSAPRRLAIKSPSSSA
jgi:predicted flavoprotein YhiN